MNKLYVVIQIDDQCGDIQESIAGIYSSEDLATNRIDALHDEFRTWEINNPAQAIHCSVSCRIDVFELDK